MHKTNKKRFYALFLIEYPSAAEQCAYTTVKYFCTFFTDSEVLGRRCLSVKHFAILWVKRAYSIHWLFDSEIVIQRFSAHAGSHIGLYKVVSAYEPLHKHGVMEQS